MAVSLRWSSLLASFLLTRSADAQDESERFPLSGGIGTGVNVKVTAGIDTSMPDALKLHFELPGGGVPFHWSPKIADSTIERSSELEGVSNTVQDWGKHTFDTQSSVTFDFLKTRYQWQVSVNGMPTPWFDFPVLTTNLITHLRIFQGFTNPMVTLTKPACSTACVSSECKDGCMQDGAAVDVSMCFSKFPQDSMGSANCSTMATTHQDGGICCDGFPESVDLQTVASGSWVEVRADSSFVGRACESFSQSESGCTGLVGRPVKIQTVNKELRTLDCWAPPSSMQTFSYYALMPHVPLVNKVAVTQADMNSLRSGGINYNSRLISKTAGGITQNWYVLAMHEQPGVADDEPWVPIIQDRWDYWCDAASSPGIQVLAVDVGTELINYVDQCTDLMVSGGVWVDKEGYKCTSYRGRGWCTPEGEEPDKFREDHGNNRQTYESVIVNGGMYAPKACCGCGGGSLGGNLANLPPPLVGMVASQVVIM